MKNVRELAEQIAEVIEDMVDCTIMDDCIGVRMDRYDYAVGDDVINSMQTYDDCEPYELCGTSATKIYSDRWDSKVPTVDEIIKIIEYNRICYGSNGSHQHIIIGDHAEDGNDKYEVVIRKAKVYAVA